jgi:hypothetical protein
MSEFNSLGVRSRGTHSRIPLFGQGNSTEQRIKFAKGGVTKSGRTRGLQMNAKRKNLLQGIASGLNVSEAGRAAGYGTAQSAHRAMNLIRIHMPEVLDKVGFPAEKLLKHFKRSLTATKTLYCTYRGKVSDTLEVPDHKIQLRAIIELLKLHGAYPMRNKRRSDDHSDEVSGPIFHLVIPELEK